MQTAKTQHPSEANGPLGQVNPKPKAKKPSGHTGDSSSKKPMQITDVGSAANSKESCPRLNKKNIHTCVYI